MNISKSLAWIGICSIFLSGCASTNYIKDQDATRVYNVSFDSMMTLVPQAVELAGMKNKSADTAQGIVMAQAPPSFWTSSLANMMVGGDEVTIRVKEIQVTQSSVFIKVVATADAMDLGRSARVVKTLFAQLDKLVQQKLSSGA